FRSREGEPPIPSKQLHPIEKTNKEVKLSKENIQNQLNRPCTSQDSTRKSNSNGSSPSVDHPTMVYNLHGNAEIEAGNDSTLSNRNDNATNSKSCTPSSQKPYPNDWDLIQQRYQNEGINESSINI
uniref:Uncharacterized protein n=1 Tax=Clytia hemisphaerica TaxID=252671 RepID=A0A7M5UYZ7_9CNID